MTKIRHSVFTRAVLALTAISLAGALGAAAPAAATPNYDGQWSVMILTQKGSCDASYRYPVRIANGALLNDGPSLINVSGKVERNGAVTVMVNAGDKSATGSGRLSPGGIGSGKWSGASCAGTWQAERRG
jgi:hypothetical protein